ncbi:hypothetical protein [Terriglobus tenax]|uniref:hypothetical protein n=1 Tax=Terriglobus tenax TaxID=1111115 RepID=UPI0021DFDAE5|nr:hypothetical protein [Terriglobus tenax]
MTAHDLKPTPEAETIFKKWIAHLNDEFTRHQGYDRRAEIVRDELHQIILGRPHGGRLNSTLVTELPMNVLIESLDPRNLTLEAESLPDLDPERFYPRKPLLFFWQAFDRSPLGLNHWLGTRFRTMLAHHIFASAGKGLQIAAGIKMIFGYNITAEENAILHRDVFLDDRQPITLRGEVGAR